MLLIGCVNVAGLLLAASAGRQTEIATRTALGCSRSKLVRQFLAESLFLGLLGSGLGLLVAYAGIAALGEYVVETAGIPIHG